MATHSKTTCSPANAGHSMVDPVSQVLGISHEITGEGTARSHVLLDGRHENPYGGVHGTIRFVTADVGMGYALMPTLEAGTRTVSTSLTVNYLKAPRGRELVAKSRLVSRGRSTATLQTEVHDEGGMLCALITGNFAVLGE